jgi:hypothetical protein
MLKAHAAAAGLKGPHCKENPIYGFPEKELRGPSPNSTFMYLRAIGPHIFLQQNRQTNRRKTVYKSLTET